MLCKQSAGVVTCVKQHQAAVGYVNKMLSWAWPVELLITHGILLQDNVIGHSGLNEAYQNVV